MDRTPTAPYTHKQKIKFIKISILGYFVFVFLPLEKSSTNIRRTHIANEMEWHCYFHAAISLLDYLV